MKRLIRGFSGCFVVISFLAFLCGVDAQELPDINGLSPQPLYFRINSEEFLNDLEVVEAQRQQIKKIDARVRADCREIPQSDEKPNLILNVVKEGLDDIFKDVLLPQQQIRFIQLVHQTELRRLGGSLANYVLQPKVFQVIGITDKQKKSLETLHKKKVAELRAAAEEFREEIVAITANKERETVALLDEPQKKKITALIGEKNIDVKPGTEARIYLEKIVQ